MSSLTSSADLAPVMPSDEVCKHKTFESGTKGVIPMEVPRPPLTLRTASLFSASGLVALGSLSYETIWSAAGDLMRSQSLAQVCWCGQSSLTSRDYIQLLALGLLGQIARKEVEEGLHLCVKHLKTQRA